MSLGKVTEGFDICEGVSKGEKESAYGGAGTVGNVVAANGDRVALGSAEDTSCSFEGGAVLAVGGAAVWCSAGAVVLIGVSI